MLIKNNYQRAKELRMFPCDLLLCSYMISFLVFLIIQLHKRILWSKIDNEA